MNLQTTLEKVAQLPKGLRPRYDTEFLDKGILTFKTRRDVCYHVWYVMECEENFNFFKEGPKYAAQIGNTIYATGWRNLHTFGVEELEQAVKNKYFY